MSEKAEHKRGLVTQPWSCHVEVFDPSRGLTVPLGCGASVTGNPVRTRWAQSLKCMTAQSGTVQHGVDRFPRVAFSDFSTNYFQVFLVFRHESITEPVSHQSECTSRQSPAKC